MEQNMEILQHNDQMLENKGENRGPLQKAKETMGQNGEVQKQPISNRLCNGDDVSNNQLNGTDTKSTLQQNGATEEDLEEMEQLLRDHSGCAGPWRLCWSALGGRGLAAARPLAAGEVVLRDPPLVLAPRAAASRSLCARCLRTGADVTLRPCAAGCGLRVCCQPPDDARQDGHLGECALLRRWGVRVPPKGDEEEQVACLSRASAAVRCLALPTRTARIVSALYAHMHPRHGKEVADLVTQLCTAPTESEVRFMKHSCAVMDANAFEVSAGVRGLYPLSAMMNNECSPNVSYGFDAEHAMVVRAAVDIPEGRELTNAYTPLLWGTPARQRHLQLTKHFLCTCDRCRDPQEFGTLLSGLRCGRSGCSGAVVSLSPLELSSDWRCCVCGWQLSAGRARALQAALGSMLAAVDTSRPEAVAAFLRSPTVTKVLLPTNQVAVELKSCLLWHYGHADGYTWEELSDEQLSWKEEACRLLLRLLQQLRAGRTRLRGLLLLELSFTLDEKVRRMGLGEAGLQAEILRSLQEAASIFVGDATAPPELWRRLAVAGMKSPGNNSTTSIVEASTDGFSESVSN